MSYIRVPQRGARSHGTRERSDCRAVEPFGIVLIVVCVIAIIAALFSIVGQNSLYQDIGKGGLSLDTPDRVAGPPAGSPAARAEAETEVRQMLEAKSARRVGRGEEPLDIDAEVARLMAPADLPGGSDESLREEVRQVVIASNARRERRGEEPLAVEAEVERRLRDLGG